MQTSRWMRSVLLAALALISAAAVGAQEPQRQQVAITEPALNPSTISLEAAIDTLTLGSDFTVYMQQSVPEQVRLRALRKLWTLLPATADFENTLY